MHLAVWAALAEAGVAVVVLNPYRARKFADALGRLAKTDAIDARVLALAAERLEAALPAPTPARRRLKELTALRRNLVARKVALTNQLAASADAFARRLLVAERVLILRHLALLEAELRACVDTDPALARTYAMLISIPGLGPVSAVALIADLPELGHASDKEIAALLGVAPMNWTPASAAAGAGSREGAHRCGRPSPWLRSQRRAQTLPSGPSATGSARPKRLTGSSSLPFFENSSCSPTPSSGTTASGRPNRLCHANTEATRIPHRWQGQRGRHGQSSTTLPELPERIAAKPSSKSWMPSRWVISGLMSSPDCTSAIILYQVSNISRP